MLAGVAIRWFVRLGRAGRVLRSPKWAFCCVFPSPRGAPFSMSPALRAPPFRPGRGARPIARARMAARPVTRGRRRRSSRTPCSATTPDRPPRARAPAPSWRRPPPRIPGKSADFPSRLSLRHNLVTRPQKSFGKTHLRYRHSWHRNQGNPDSFEEFERALGEPDASARERGEGGAPCSQKEVQLLVPPTLVSDTARAVQDPRKQQEHSRELVPKS